MNFNKINKEFVFDDSDRWKIILLYGFKGVITTAKIFDNKKFSTAFGRYSPVYAGDIFYITERLNESIIGWILCPEYKPEYTVRFYDDDLVPKEIFHFINIEALKDCIIHYISFNRDAHALSVNNGDKILISTIIGQGLDNITKEYAEFY